MWCGTCRRFPVVVGIVLDGQTEYFPGHADRSLSGNPTQPDAGPPGPAARHIEIEIKCDDVIHMHVSPPVCHVARSTRRQAKRATLVHFSGVQASVSAPPPGHCDARWRPAPGRCAGRRQHPRPNTFCDNCTAGTWRAAIRRRHSQCGHRPFVYGRLRLRRRGWCRRIRLHGRRQAIAVLRGRQPTRGPLPQRQPARRPVAIQRASRALSPT